MDGLLDTIVAQATPPGRGALAVVRLSGPRTRDILERVAEGLPVAPEPRRAYLVSLTDPVGEGTVDRGLLTWFPAPNSYTGEDVAEFSGHGGGYAVRRVVEAFRSAGARLAQAGEFTRRAYLNGKLDLVQAEAVADLVEGSSPRLHREAMRQLDRHLSRRIAELRSELIEVEALLAHHIDFPDEDEPPVPADRIIAEANRLQDALEHLARTAPEGERLREGALVVLAGRPNTGKSSLYNALVGEERALVTEIAGTTRDALEADIAVDGYPVRLVDTAGLRDAEGVVEQLGIEVARRFLEHADLVLYCRVAGAELDAEERAWIEASGVPVLQVATMADRAVASVGTEGGTLGAVAVSVVSGRGLDELRGAVARAVFGVLEAHPDDAPVLTRARQGEAVARAAREVEVFGTALADGVPAEYASTHLKAAASALEEVVGLVDTDDVLDRLFATFCIGK
jgi:tRNA modification GTPase